MNGLTRCNNFHVIDVAMARASILLLNAIFYLSRITGVPIRRGRFIKSTILCRLSRTFYVAGVQSAYNRSIISRRGSCQNRLEFLMARIKDGAWRASASSLNQFYGMVTRARHRDAIINFSGKSPFLLFFVRPNSSYDDIKLTYSQFVTLQCKRVFALL